MSRAKTASTLDGHDFVAVVGLRDIAGVRVNVGESCARVKTASLAGLLECGAIRPIEKAGE